MKQALRRVLTIGVVVSALSLAFIPGGDVLAQSAIEEACQTGSSSALCNQNNNGNISTIVQTVVNVLLFIIGLVSVIMIIIAGFRYTTSGGDSGAVSSAKNTILYAVIGLIVAFVAFAIVNFVIGTFS